MKNKDYNPYTDKFAKDWSDPDAERKKRGETTALSYEAISMYLASAIRPCCSITSTRASTCRCGTTRIAAAVG